MEENRALLVPLGLTSLVGGAVGASLLIWTPSETFARLVPFLIFFATILFMAQEPISRLMRLRRRPTIRREAGGRARFSFNSARQFMAAISARATAS
jgi:uncharacterized membrane protein YfcA